ncbi:hypothetical protein J5X92_01750 [Alteromonas sp. K632G]|uniref:hypothetical protein n=1 Tax=Alteromonas sp. K632G TaxID=2820757 RepID=UPI001AD7797A|nr:hypothetical protein [Alteromonas sp. K632G]MBO7920940.1 hypothetical protein [Alteromonas sp. K632G]
MNRCFDINLNTAPGWTEGDSWDYCNPAQELGNIYSRKYDNDDGENLYRLETGDNFYIACSETNIRDWWPETTPFTFDVDGVASGEISFYYGIQVGDSEINFKVNADAPYMVGDGGTLYQLDADYHRYYGLRVRGYDRAIQLQSESYGLTIDSAVTNKTQLIDTNGHSLNGAKLSKITRINADSKFLVVPQNSNDVSLQGFHCEGEGDIGLVVEEGHSKVIIAAGEIKNDNHDFKDSNETLTGLYIGESANEAVVIDMRIRGFSGPSHEFHCPVNTEGLTSYYSGAGVYFGKGGKARDCMVSWLRQIEGDSYAYYANGDLELNNCGCLLDETGGLAAIVLAEGATATINGGKYRLNIPMPFLTALGDATAILNNVTINGVLYNTTLDFRRGESWLGTKAQETTEALPVYANQTLYLPFMQIPNLVNAISVQGSDRPFEKILRLPSGASIAPTSLGSMRYIPGDAYLGIETPVEDFVRFSTEDQIFVHRFIIHPSPEVSAKLISPDALSGSGWSKNGERYTANNSSSALSASYSFEAGEIYQISLKIEGRTSGGVVPSIGSAQGQYSHYVEGTEVWLIRAPSNATSVSIAGQSFTGDVLNCYVRKLIRTETPAVPELEATVIGSDVNLEWFIVPQARIRDTENQVYITGELNGTRDGYFNGDNSGHFLFENTYSNGKKSAVNIRGGDSLEVWRMKVTGGYTGSSSTWQTAITADQNNGPYMALMQVCYLTADLGLNSNQGNYNGPTNNSDILLSNGLSSEEVIEARAYVLGLDGSNASDGIADIKKHMDFNHCSSVGGYRPYRVHNFGGSLICNSSVIRTYGTKEAFAPTHARSIIELWNASVDGERCVTNDQMKSQVNGEGFHYSTAGVVGSFRDSVFTLKSYPTINDYCRVAMTDMQFEYSSDGGANWQSLAVPDVGLPGVVGCFKRTLNLASGNYQIRCRCLNGALIGDWSNLISITI